MEGYADPGRQRVAVDHEDHRAFRHLASRLPEALSKPELPDDLRGRGDRSYARGVASKSRRGGVTALIASSASALEALGAVQ